jgi:hypothetical protein
MGTLSQRIEALEKIIAGRTPLEPMPIFILPEEGNPERADIQAKIDALERAGKKVIVIVRASARL